MKKLELNQMEDLRGDWSWGQCTGGALSLAYAYGNSPAVIVGGFLGSWCSGTRWLRSCRCCLKQH